MICACTNNGVTTHDNAIKLDPYISLGTRLLNYLLSKSKLSNQWLPQNGAQLHTQTYNTYQLFFFCSCFFLVFLSHHHYHHHHHHHHHDDHYYYHHRRHQQRLQ
uniref:Uncharacterized protein n=1 Tax=Glossina brevipalpis TaxID=37001 RepID=A0A1A9X1H6_9MUSC